MSWGEIKKVNSDLTKSLDVLMKEQSSQIIAGIPVAKSPIKSIQKGTLYIPQFLANAVPSPIIYISPVVVEKSMLIVSGSIPAGGRWGNYNVAYTILPAFNISTTTISCVFPGFLDTAHATSYGGSFSWQVIEFN